jgi:WD40 repeat protein
LWAFTIAIVAYFYGYYSIASGWLGLSTLLVLAAASVGLLFLFRSCSKPIAAANYEMCILAVWFVHLMGTAALGGGSDIEWFCISFLWPWLFFAVVGGITVLASSRKTDSPSRRTNLVAAAVLSTAAVLVACGFAHLRLCEEQPVAAFRAVRFFLQGIAFSPDGKTIATVGGISGRDKDVRLWDAATGRALGECDKECANNGMEKAALQCFGNPSVVAASSYLSAFPRSDNKIVIQVWDLANQTLKKRLMWDDDLRISQSAFSRDGRWFVYSNGNLRAFDLQTEQLAVDLKRQNDDSVRCIAISLARDRLACATDEKELEIWDISSAQLLQRRRTTGRVSCMDFAPDGRFLAYGTDSGAIEQVEIGAEKAARGFPSLNGESIDALLFSPDGTLLACAGGHDVSAKVIDISRGEVVAVLRTWGNWRTNCLAFSLDGSRLATGDANGRVGVWDANKWIERR